MVDRNRAKTLTEAPGSLSVSRDEISQGERTLGVFVSSSGVIPVSMPLLMPIT